MFSPPSPPKWEQDCVSVAAQKVPQSHRFFPQSGSRTVHGWLLIKGSHPTLLHTDALSLQGSGGPAPMGAPSPRCMSWGGAGLGRPLWDVWG